MKKRRKVLSVMLCAAMIASLAACGSKGDDKKSSDDGGKVKLTFSTSVYVEEPHQKAIDALLEAYSKKEPNVEIEILGAGYDGYWDNITTEILSNNESDMIQVYPENISTYNAIRDGGTFMDLSEYMSDDLKEKLVGQDMCDVDGQTLAISSYAWGTTGIFYRKSMLKDAGVNPDEIKTQEDFRKACKKFTDDGKYAMGVVSGTHAFTVSEWNRLIARPVCLVWILMYDKDYGIINFLLNNAGILSHNIAYLQDVSVALPAAMVVNIWKGFPYVAIMLLAGMQSVSTDLYEAADIDGATTFQKIRYITIPAIRSVSTTVFLLLIIWTIKDYAIAYVLTKGGPSRATELLTIYIQQTGFKYFDFGKASAAGMLMLLVALAFTFFYFKVLNKEEE